MKIGPTNALNAEQSLTAATAAGLDIVSQTPQVIRLSALQELLGGVSKSTIRRLERNPKSGFPKRMRISTRVVAWELNAVMDWLATRPHGFGQ